MEKSKEVRGVYGLDEFLSVLNSPPINPANAELAARWNTDASDVGWHGLAKDIQEREPHVQASRRLAKHGWQHGAKLISDVLPQVKAPDPVSIKRRRVMADAGVDLDQQAVWSGDIDRAWHTLKRRAGKGPARVRILVDSLAKADVSASSMRWRGVAALVCADLLTAAGYNVQVESVFHGRDNNHDFLPRVIVKPYEQPLDLLVLAATTALPAFFRSLGHLWGAIASPVKRCGVGYSVNDAKLEYWPDESDNSICVMFGQNVSTALHAVQAVESAIRKVERAGGILLDVA